MQVLGDPITQLNWGNEFTQINWVKSTY